MSTFDVMLSLVAKVSPFWAAEPYKRYPFVSSLEVVSLVRHPLCCLD